MKTNPTPRIEIGLLALLAAVGLGFFALVQAPTWFGVAAPSTPEYAANQQRIEDMTQAERDRIKLRQEKFAEMSESRRNEIRQLHDDLRTSPDAKDLQAVLKRYNAWLTSLPIDERDKLREQLRKAKTATEQRQIVVGKKQEKDDERLVQSAPSWERIAYHREKDPAKKEEILARIREAFAYGSQRNWRPRLNASELDTVINVIAAQLHASETQLAAWELLKPEQRRLKVMIAAMAEHTERRKRLQPGLLSDSELWRPIEDGIKNADLRDRLLKKPGFRRRGPWSNYGVLILIKNSIDDDRQRETGNPSVEELSQFFQTLSEKRMDELTQLGPERLKTLKRWYFFSGGENGEDYRTFVTEYYSLFRPYGFRSPSGKSQRKPGTGGGRRGGRRNGERSRKQKP